MDEIVEEDRGLRVVDAEDPDGPSSAEVSRVIVETWLARLSATARLEISHHDADALCVDITKAIDEPEAFQGARAVHLWGALLHDAFEEG